MPFDLQGYYDKYKDWYGNVPLADVAKDAFARGGYDKEYPSFEHWTQAHGIDKTLAADAEKRKPKTWGDKLRDAVSHVAPAGFEDIPTSFVKGATFGYVPAAKTPKDAGTVHKIARGAAELAGMGVGLLPAAAVLPEATTVAGAAATSAALGGVYGAIRKPEEGETRTANALKDAAMFGAFGAGGKAIEAGLGKALPETVGAILKKIKAKEPLTDAERAIHGSMQYVTSGALGMGAGATEPAQDLRERLQNVLIGAGTFAGAHGLSQGFSRLRQMRAEGRPAPEVEEYLQRMQHGAALTQAIDTGMTTGRLGEEPFTKYDAMAAIKTGWDKGIYTEEDVDRFKDRYPQLGQELNVLYAQNAAEKVNRILSVTPMAVPVGTPTGGETPRAKEEFLAGQRQQPAVVDAEVTGTRAMPGIPDLREPAPLQLPPGGQFTRQGEPYNPDETILRGGGPPAPPALPAPEGGYGADFRFTETTPEGDIITAVGKPFATERNAKASGDRQGIDWNLYEVKPRGEGFAITRKPGREFRPEDRATEATAAPQEGAAEGKAGTSPAGTGVEAGRGEIGAQGGAQEAPAPAKAREPWEMTRGEYARHVAANPEASRGAVGIYRDPRREAPDVAAKVIGSYATPTGTMLQLSIPAGHVQVNTDQFHRGMVEQAIAAGRPVPPAVLADYPELQAKGEAPAQQQKQPWQMSRAEFQYAENAPKVEAIQTAIRAGKPIVVTTNLRATRLAKPEHIRITSDGTAQIPRGKHWDALTDDLLDRAAAQAGVKAPSLQERVYHRAAVGDALAAGLPVPATVRAEYPDLKKPARKNPAAIAPAPKLSTGPQNAVTFLQKQGGVDFGAGRDYNVREIRQDPDGRRLHKTGGMKPDEAASLLNDEGLVSPTGEEWTGDSLAEAAKSGQLREVFTPERRDAMIARKLKREENEWIAGKLADLEEAGHETGDLASHRESLGAGLLDEAKAEGLAPADLSAAEAELNDFFDSVTAQTPKAEERPAAPVKASFAEIVNDAQRWKGAALKADALYGNDTKARLAHSRMTTKSDLDAYLMKKYGIDSSLARDASNELTRYDLKPNMEAEVAEFAGEPWADKAMQAAAPQERPVAPGASGELPGTSYAENFFLEPKGEAGQPGDVKPIKPGQRQGDIAFSTTPQPGRVTIDTIKNHPRFRNAAVTENPDGSAVVRFPNGDGFRVDFITDLGADRGVELKTRYGTFAKSPGDRIAGVFVKEDDGQKTLVFNVDHAGVPTVDHEHMHFLEHSGYLDSRDLRILTMGAKRAGFAADEEGRADFVAEAFRKRDEQPGLVRQVLQKIGDFFDTILNAVGVRTERGVLRDIESGAALRREPLRAAGERATESAMAKIPGKADIPAGKTPGAEGGEEYNRRAIKKYGITTVTESIGFITRDGRGIDSSGRRQGSPSQGRNIDHREIAQHALGDDSTDGWSENMRLFMDKTGDIRVVGAKNEVNIDVPIKNGMPSQKQLNVVKGLAEDKKIYYDFTDAKGHVVTSGEGSYSKFVRELQQAIKNEGEIQTALSSGEIPKQLQPIADFIKSNDLTKEEFRDIRYNDKNPRHEELNKLMDGASLGINKIWEDFGFGHQGEFYDRVMQVLPKGRSLPDESRPPGQGGQHAFSLASANEKLEQAKDRLARWSDERHSVKAATESVGMAYDQLKRAFYPAARSDDARKVAETLIAAMGKNWRQAEQFKGELNRIVTDHREATSVAAKAFDIAQTSTGIMADTLFAKMGKDAQHQFIYRIQHDEAQNTPELQEIANTIGGLFDTLWHEADRVMPGATKYRENYFPGMWEKPDEAEKFFSGRSKKLEGSKAHTKAKVFDDIYEGIEAGLTPRGTPLDMAFEKLHDMQKYITAHRTLQQMEEEGAAILVKPGEKAPAGYTLIPEPYGILTKQDGMSYRYAAKEDVAQVINNYLSRSLYDSPYVGQMYRGYMGAANTLNQFQLGVGSAFHAGFTSMESVISKFALGVKAAARGDFADAAKTMLESPLQVYRNPMFGDKIMRAYRGEDVQGQEIPQIVNWLEMAGARAHMDARLRTSVTKSAIEDWSEGRKATAIAKTPFSAVEQMARPIMEWLVPRQKFGVFAEMANEWHRQNPTATHEQMRSAMQYIWNRVDARLGQVVYERLFMHKVAQGLLQAGMRAPGWTGGTIVEIGGGVNDFGTAIRDLAAGRKAEMTDKMAYTISLLTVTGIINAVMTKLMTGEDPKDGRDLLAFRTGRTDEQGNPERMLLPTYAKDIYAYINKPGQTLLNKSHPIIGLMSEMAKNKDYYGVQIREPDDSYIKQAGELGMHIAGAFVPFWMRGAEKERERGGSFASKATPLIGIMPATSEFTKTDAQKLMSDILRERPKGTTTQAKWETTQLKHRLELRLRNKDEEAGASIEQALKEGKISRRDANEIHKAARQPYAVAAFKHLTAEEAIRVYRVASDQERKVFYPLLRKKMQGVVNLPADQRFGAVQRFREAMGMPATEEEESGG